MKRYLILVAILVVGTAFVASCSGEGSQPMSTDIQQRIAELEKQVASLTERTTVVDNDSIPLVLERDVSIEKYYTGKWKENRLSFSLKPGERVEGEVSIVVPEGASAQYTWGIVAQARDPYGSSVARTDDVVDSGGLMIVANRGFPWRFAFVAYIEGQYTLDAFGYQATGQLAHLKVTCYRSQ